MAWRTRLSFSSLAPFVQVELDRAREHFGDLEHALRQLGVGPIGDVLRRAQDRGVDLLVAEGDVACGSIGHDQHFELVGVRLAGLVELVEALGDDAAARNVLLELERPPVPTGCEAKSGFSASSFGRIAVVPEKK